MYFKNFNNCDITYDYNAVVYSHFVFLKYFSLKRIEGCYGHCGDPSDLINAFRIETPRGKSPIMWRFPLMRRCIISYQEVLSSLLKNVND
jgi:hypothetical protein